MHSDLALALRLEKIAADFARSTVHTHRALYPDSAAAAVDCGSGVAAFIDETSPLTQVKGAGMRAPSTESELDDVEAFYEERMSPVTFVLSPVADAALFTYLSRRGYEIGTFENALFRPMQPEDAELPPDPDVQPAGEEEWSRTLSEAFFDIPTPGSLELGRTLYNVPACSSLIIRAGDIPAAGAQVAIYDGVALLQCDGTVRKYREVGLQKKLIRHRLYLAAAAGCDVATADTQPGSLSQRNYEKLGFRVAYTRVTLIKP